jgi:pentatricopeptide repeat protein
MSRYKLGTREQAFAATKIIKKLDKENKVWEMLAYFFGPKVQALKASNKFSRGVPGQLKESTLKNGKFMDYGCTKRVEVWNTMLSCMAARGLGEQCFKLRRKMKDMGASTSDETISILLKGAAQSMMKNKTSLTKSSVAPEKIEVYTKAKSMFMRVQEEISSGQMDRGVNLSIIHVNGMLQCASHAKDWKHVFELYSRLAPVNGEKPAEDRVAPKADDSEEFDEDEDSTPKTASKDIVSKLNPSIRTFSILLNACGRIGGDGGCNKAIEIWKDLKRRIDLQNKRPPKDYNTDLSKVVKKKHKNDLISEAIFGDDVYTKNELIDKIKKEENERLQIDTDVINSMIYACAQAESDSKLLNAFLVAQQEFQTIIILEFFKKFKKDESFKNLYLKYVKKVENGEIMSDSAQDGLIALGCAPNSKSVSLLLTTLTKLKAPSKVIYDFYEEASGVGFGRADRDISLKLHALQIMASSNDISRGFKVFSDIEKDVKKENFASGPNPKGAKVVVPSLAVQNILKLISHDNEKESLDRNKKLAQKLWEDSCDAANRDLSDYMTGHSFRPTPVTFIYFLKTIKDPETIRAYVDEFYALSQKENDSKDWRIDFAKKVTQMDSFAYYLKNSSRSSKSFKKPMVK